MSYRVTTPLSLMLAHASWASLFIYRWRPMPLLPCFNLRSHPSSLDIEAIIVYSSRLPIGVPYFIALCTASSSGVGIIAPRSITM